MRRTERAWADPLRASERDSATPISETAQTRIESACVCAPVVVDLLCSCGKAWKGFFGANGDRISWVEL